MASQNTDVIPTVQHSKVDIDTRADEKDDFPEGGWEAWMTIAGGKQVFSAVCNVGICQFLWSLSRYASSEFYRSLYLNNWITQDFYVREYLTKYSPSDIGWIGGTQIFFLLASGIITGRAFDKGYFHHMMIAGAILSSFSLFMLSLSHQNQYYQVFLSHGLGGGLAAGLQYIPTLAISSHYFKRHRALTVGIMASGAGLGAVLHPIILNHLFHDPGSFAKGVRISAALNSGLLLVANLMMRTRLPPSKRHSRIPIAEFARDTPYVFVVIGGMLLVFGISFSVFFLQLYSNNNQINKVSRYSLAIMNGASIAGRIIPAAFAPICGNVNLNIFCTICMATLIYSLVAVKSVGGVVAFATIYGFFQGAVVTLTPTMLASLAKDVDEVGARIGVSFALTGITGLFATPIEGALLTTHMHWWRPIVLSGTGVLGCALLYIIALYILVQRTGSYTV